MMAKCPVCESKGHPADIESYIEEYIASLPAETAADGRLAQARLKKCACCKHRAGLLCRVCGCFVQVRAAKKIAFCPAPEGSYWEQ